MKSILSPLLKKKEGKKSKKILKIKSIRIPKPIKLINGKYYVRVYGPSDSETISRQVKFNLHGRGYHATLVKVDGKYYVYSRKTLKHEKGNLHYVP